MKHSVDKEQACIQIFAIEGKRLKSIQVLVKTNSLPLTQKGNRGEGKINPF